MVAQNVWKPIAWLRNVPVVLMRHAEWLALIIVTLAPTGSFGATPVVLQETRHLFDISNSGGIPLLLPTDVALTGDGTSYIVDSGNHRVVSFSPQGRPAFSFGGIGRGEGKFRDPLGIALDNRQRVYVADAGNHRIQIFDSRGHFLRAIPLRDASGPLRPADMVVSPSGDRIYVSDSTRHRVVAISADGKQMEAWGREGAALGEFRYPATMAMLGERLFVVDVLNTRVQILDVKGQFQYQVGEWGVLSGQLFRPKGVALDRRGLIYVSDSYMDLIQVFDTDYRFLYVLGRGKKIAKFVAPTGIAIDDRERLFVVEMLSNKVSVHSLH